MTDSQDTGTALLPMPRGYGEGNRDFDAKAEMMLVESSDSSLVSSQKIVKQNRKKEDLRGLIRRVRVFLFIS